MEPQVAAPLACPGLTTYSALRTLGDVTGPVLLIRAGGLGLTCIQLMQALGMRAPIVADID